MRTVFSASAVEFLGDQEVREVEEYTASLMCRRMLAIRTSDAFDAGSRNGRSKGKKTDGEFHTGK